MTPEEARRSMATRRTKERLFVGSFLLLLGAAAVYLGLRELEGKRAPRQRYDGAPDRAPAAWPAPVLTDRRPEADVSPVGS